MENNRIDFISSLNLSKPENLNKFFDKIMGAYEVIGKSNLSKVQVSNEDNDIEFEVESSSPNEISKLDNTIINLYNTPMTVHIQHMNYNLFKVKLEECLS